ncbi:MAG: clostripain-related cysteine peptidase [bacterium]|nr:clostripain-related cysteine peptidase [bacterium]
MRRYCVWLLVLLISVSLPISAQTQDTFTGTLNDDKPFYEYPLLIEEANTTIIADVIATSGNLDTILYLLDDAGNVLAQNDNRTRDDLNAAINYPSADSGTYTLLLARYDVQDGTTSGDFSLTISLAPTITELPTYDLSTQALTDAGYPILEPKANAEWTVLVYYGADTDLEEALIVDLKEFELAGGGGDGVNIVAFIDRTPDYSTVSGDWSGAKIYEVTANVAGDETTTTISSSEIVSLGDVDSGDGLTLAQFLMWGIRHYPANHYALAFGSHGAGWSGVITDNTAKSIITLPELDHAFSAVNGVSPVNFELVINDACLMSSAEYHSVMAKYFKTSFASPEVVVDPALNMTLFATNLRANPAIENIPTIGTDLVNHYIDVDVLSREGSDNLYMTNAVTDLTDFATLQTTLDEFAQLVLTDPLRYSPIIGGARTNAYTYTAFRNGASLIDLGSFMRQIILLADDDRLIASAQSVLRALQAGVIYGKGGERVTGRVLYQNIYFPEKAKNFDNAYFTDSPLSSWGEMLRAYYNALTPKVWRDGELFHPPSDPQVAITTTYPETPSIANPVRLGLEITGRNIGRGIFTVDYALPTGGYERLIESSILEQAIDELGNITLLNNWGSGVELSTFGWDVMIFQLTDGTTNRPVLTRDANETTAIEGRYRVGDSETWHDVIVIFGEDPQNFSQWIVTRIISRDPNSDALGVVEIPDEAQFQVYITLVTGDGQTQIVPDETTTFTWAKNQIRLTNIPAPSGDYNMGFAIETFGGGQTLTTIPTTINNDDLPPNTRGYTSLSWGYTVVLDNNWSSLIETEFGYAEAYLNDEIQELRVYTYTAITEELFVEDVLTEYSLEALDTQNVTINNESIELVTYQGAESVGVGALFPTPDGDAIFVGVETFLSDPDFDLLATTAQTIISNLTLFNAVDLLAQDTALWDSQVIGATTDIAIGARYNIPKSWAIQQFEDGIWVGGAPSFAQDPLISPIFYRITQVEAYDVTVLLDALLADEIIPNTTNFTITERRTYYAQFNTWQVALYTAERNGQSITGRLYTMVRDFSRGYAVWLEAPSDIAPTLFSEVFEPLIDAFRPNEPLRPYPLADYGFVIYFPRDWGYVQDMGDYIFNANFDKTIEYYVDFYPEENTLEGILSVWQADNNVTLLDEPQEAEYNRKAGLVVSFTGEDREISYNGYAFITTSADGTKGAVVYMTWIETEPNFELFESNMGYNNYGIPPEIPTSSDEFSYAPSWFEASDTNIGLNIAYPTIWGDITMLNNLGAGGYAFIQSPTGANQLKIYVQPSTDLEGLLIAEYDYANITLERLDDISIAGVAGLQFAITVEEEDITSTGKVIAFVGENGFSYIFEFLGDGRRDITPLIDRFISEISTFPPALPSDEIQTNQIQVISYTVRDLGITFSLPDDWSEPVIEDNLLFAGLDDGSVALYIYIQDESLPLEEMVERVLETFGMERISEYEQGLIDRRAMLEFELAYDDFYGIAMVLEVNDRTLMISVEGTDADAVLGYYQLIIESLRFGNE